MPNNGFKSMKLCHGLCCSLRSLTHKPRHDASRLKPMLGGRLWRNNYLSWRQFMINVSMISKIKFQKSTLPNYRSKLLRFNHFSMYLLFLGSLLMVSCTTFSSIAFPASANPTGPRTLILDGKSISEDEIGGFISWYCVDYIDGGPILVEVGYFGDTEFESIGFILYEGGYIGELTYYSRTGLEHRWDWGPNDEYAFVIKPDGTGLYYDFSSVKVGTSTKARSVYKAYRR